MQEQAKLQNSFWSRAKVRLSSECPSVRPTPKPRKSTLFSLNIQDKRECEMDDETRKDQKMNKTKGSCPNCSGNHYLYRCQDFRSASLVVRRKFVDRRRLC